MVLGTRSQICHEAGDLEGCSKLGASGSHLLPSYLEAEIAQANNSRHSISKITRAKWTGGVPALQV
jgi:hypothetical protein